ncbi:MAG TPA: PKD domain-containing protein [Anaeromyxobacteraceae bacterium]|nr:PKD domain-containing protein [Anaeromyxobacteraceae bacterium]
MQSPGGLPARAFAACLIALLTACGGEHRQLRACQKDSDCGSGAFCVASVCAADTAPAASISGTPASALIAGQQVVFDGSGSSDPDPGDAVASYAWTVTGGACASVPASSAQPRLDTVFGCAGNYTVALVVTDSRGRPSPPASVTVTVVAAGTGAGTAGNPSPSADLPPPTVLAADDLAVDHSCQGTPASCTTVDPGGSQVLRLSAAGKDVFGAPVGYHWSYEPPLELNGQPAPKVEFLSGTDAAEVEVRISTAGTPLSGAWRFFVTVTDARNKKARDELVVTVKDRPVVVSGGAQLALAHRYDPATRRYLAEGSAPVAWTDPDNDAFNITSKLESAQPNGCVLTAAQEPGGMKFRIDCPSLIELIGADAKHVLAFTATDPAGNTASARFALSVADQPPLLSSDQAAALLTPPHRYDPVTRLYSAELSVDLSWSDPDGDPVSLTWSHEAARANGCSLSPSLAGNRATLRLECADLNELAGGDIQHAAVLTASDGGGQTATLRFRVAPQDFPPTISLGSSQSIGHRYDPARQLYTASFSTPLSWSDPEGDPLTVTWSDEASRPNGCALAAEVDGSGTAQVRLECANPLELLGLVNRAVVCTVSDGGGRSAVARFPLTIGNQPPVVTALPSISLDHRVDLSGTPRYLAEGPYSIQVIDPDGDPLTSQSYVEVDAAWAPHATAAVSGGSLLVQVPLAYPEELRRGDDSSPFKLVTLVNDPWENLQVSTAVLVKDRAPVLTTSSPSLLPVMHRYDGAGYRTDPAIASGVWVDPDGDPIQVTATSSGLCNRLGLVASVAGWQVTAACELAYAAAQGGLPPLANLVKQHAVSYALQDPWGQGGIQSITVSVLDRAPGGSIGFANCQPRRNTCRTYDPVVANYEVWTESMAPTFTATPVGTDPDGDPLQVTWRASQPDPGVPSGTCYPVAGIQATCAAGAPCASVAMAGCEVHESAGNCQLELAGTAGVEVTDGVVGMSITAGIPSCP